MGVNLFEAGGYERLDEDSPAIFGGLAQAVLVYQAQQLLFHAGAIVDAGVSRRRLGASGLDVVVCLIAIALEYLLKRPGS